MHQQNHIRKLTGNSFDIASIPGLPSLWNETTGDPGICIAMLDGPVDINHSCFNGGRLQYIGNDADVINNTAAAHGTHVASIIFSNDKSLMSGIAPQCSGLFIPIYHEEQGATTCSQLDLANAIRLAAQKGAHIINISGGQFSPDGESELLLSAVIKECTEAGILIIAAAGNNGCECLHIPAADPSVLAIGAMDAAGHPLEFSNWGTAYRKNGLLFPGEHIAGACSINGVSIRSGTSFATAIASGIAGLLMSWQLKLGLPVDGRMIHQVLLANAIPCHNDEEESCRRLLAGRLNLPAVINDFISKTNAGGIMAAAYDGHLPTQLFNKNQSHHLTRGGNIMNQETNEMVAMPPVEATSTQETTWSLPASADVNPQGIEPSCACQDKPKEIAPLPQLVYTIGTLGHEFRSEAARDAFRQLMNGNPNDPLELLNYLDKNPDAAEGVTWTLSLEATPVYALIPAGGFAAATYGKLREYLKTQLTEGAQRISVPGLIIGKIRLLSGQEVQVIAPRIYGMYNWTTTALVQAVLGDEPADKTKKDDFGKRKDGIHNFLDRVYYEIRNLGQTPKERAINYAATNAFQVERVFENAVNDDLELDTIDVERSPICRPHSDCWDVKLVFFHPLKRMERARKVFRFTIDVSDIIPVTVGRVRSWNVF